MKIILSRKGTDSSSGGFASPIFADGRMVSIPIPDKRAVISYRDVLNPALDSAGATHDRSFKKLVRDLSGGKLTGATKVHLDPDLDKGALPRAGGWRPLFGQHGAAQSHLESQGVGAGDVFLFFGWFRQVEYLRRRWRYVAGAPDQHIIFGWMQVQSVEPAVWYKQSAATGWAHYHPHCLDGFSGTNVIYKARQKLNGITDKTKALPAGAGMFGKYNDQLRLTADGVSRTHWQLPLWMHPEGRASTLSYHSDIKRWTKDKDRVALKSVARGQEFVLDLDHYPEGHLWLQELFGLT